MVEIVERGWHLKTKILEDSSITAVREERHCQGQRKYSLLAGGKLDGRLSYKPEEDISRKEEWLTVLNDAEWWTGWKKKKNSWLNWEVSTDFIYLFCLFAFSGATPVAYGGSQAGGLIRAVAAGLRQSHSNAGSKLRLQPTPQLMATPDP